MPFAQAKIDSTRYFSYYFLMTNSVKALIAIAIVAAQGVRVGVVVRVTGEKLRG